VAQTVERLLEAICIKNRWTLISKEIQPDHVHIFVSLPPVLAIAQAVRILKGTTAYQIFKMFPGLKNRFWGGHLWSPSYYVGTAGNVSAATIRRYIERSEHVGKRR
jgi:putative transposase